MSWTPLPTGGFTGIDWAGPSATDGADPYLVWAETDQFAGYGGQPRWLPVAIELVSSVAIAQFIAAASPHWLHVPAVYTLKAAPEGLRFCTAKVKPAFFRHTSEGGRLHAMVKRLELGLPARNHGKRPRADTRDLPATSKRRRGSGPTGKLLLGKVLGLIDDSLALVNANFLDGGGKARTAFFWRQDGRGKGDVPASMGYGHELIATDIDAAMRHHRYAGMVDESAVYTTLGLSTLGKKAPHGRVGFHALDTSISHGTHVMDLAAGPRTLLAQVANLPPGFEAPPSWAMAGDDASRSPIVAVQLDYDTVADTSGGSLNVHVLDGLMYILSCCDSSAKVAVNVSFGTLAGPHDGTSLLEAAMDQLLLLCGKRLQIILPAGNGYQSRAHANATLKKKPKTLNWVVPPDDRSQSFLELWLQPGVKAVEIEITPPSRSALPPLRFGQSRTWLDEGGKPLCALIYPRSVATGEKGTCALVALAPTSGFANPAATASSGVWRIQLTNTQGRPVTIDAYVERDDVVIGTPTGARQSYLEDRWYDTSGNPGAFVDHPDNPSLIRRSGNFNSIATGDRTVSVGGVRISDASWARYSPRKPDPDAARPQRPGVVKVPDGRGYSDENPVLTGVNAAGTRSSAVVRLRGTSDAAPQVTRRIFNAM